MNGYDINLFYLFFYFSWFGYWIERMEEVFMTEKRFTLKLYSGTNRIKSILDNGKIIYPREVVDLLNEQHETIQRLKDNIDELMKLDVEEGLLKENKQLKQQMQTILKLTKKIEDCTHDIKMIGDVE